MSPDGKLLASGSLDHTIKLWSLPQGGLIKTLEGHTSNVDALVMSPDGKLLASSSLDNTIKLWSLPDGKLVGCLMDLAANPAEVKGITYEVKSTTGVTMTVTLPCGAPIPSGALCTCNCVAGGYVSEGGGGGSSSGGSHYWYPN